jgi:hypothetical protein
MSTGMNNIGGYGGGGGNNMMMNRPQYNNNGGGSNPMVRAQRPPNVTVGLDGMNAWRQQPRCLEPSYMAAGKQHQGFHFVGGRYQPVIQPGIRQAQSTSTNYNHCHQSPSNVRAKDGVNFSYRPAKKTIHHHQMNKKEEDIFPDDDFIFQIAGSTFVQQKEDEEDIFPDDDYIFQIAGSTFVQQNEDEENMFPDDDDDILCMDMMQMQQFQQLQAQQVYPRNYYRNDEQNFTTTNSSSSGYAHAQYVQYEYPH